MNSLAQFKRNYGYKYTMAYHSVDQCDTQRARDLTHDFRVAAGAFLKREAPATPALRTAQAARVHLVKCLLHRIATRSRYPEQDIGHEGQLRLLLGHLEEVNSTMERVTAMLKVADKPVWRSLQTRISRVVYPRQFLTPPRRIAVKDYAPQNLVEYGKFYSAIKPQANMFARNIIGGPITAIRSRPATAPPRRGAGGRATSPPARRPARRTT